MLAQQSGRPSKNPRRRLHKCLDEWKQASTNNSRPSWAQGTSLSTSLYYYSLSRIAEAMMAFHFVNIQTFRQQALAGNFDFLRTSPRIPTVLTEDSFNITSAATFILLRRAPLLSGAINREDLDHLLQDCLGLSSGLKVKGWLLYPLCHLPWPLCTPYRPLM